MDVVLLHNEKAGDEEWSRKQLVKLVRSAGLKPRYFELDEALAKPQLLDEGEFVVVAGGDGSIRKAALKLLARNRPLAPLPVGTANNISRSLGLPRDPEAIVAGWKNSRRRRIDIGVVRGPWGRQRFIEGVGLGLVSRIMGLLQMIEDVSELELKKAKHRLHRAVCVAVALTDTMPPIRARLQVDGQKQSDDFVMLEILNIRHAGPALALAPHANPSDGRFDVVTVAARQRARLMQALKDRLSGADAPRNLAAHRASSVRFTVAEACELRIDDGTHALAAGTTVEVTIEAKALELVLPE